MRHKNVGIFNFLVFFFRFLAEADQEVIQATGRADQENSPSHLTKVINRIITELTDMFKDGVAGLFKSAREGEDEEEDSKEDLVEGLYNYKVV